VDNNRGRIDFAATLLNPALPVSGDRAVIGITFRGRQAGVSALSFEAVILSTRLFDLAGNIHLHSAA